MHRLTLLALCACLGLTLAGCGDPPNRTTERAALTGVGQPRPLGWLAGSARPGSDSREITLDGRGQLAGTLIVDAVAAAGPLASAGVQTGDVLVAVDDRPLPIKDDPTLDLLNELEQARSAGGTTATLTLLRQSATQQVEIPLPETSLEDGLPLDVARFNHGAARARATLDAGQISDPATLAYWGLALLAGGETDQDRLAAIAEQLHERLAASADATALSAAIQFEAERIGALPDDVLVRIAEESAAPRLPTGPGGPSFEGAMVVNDLSELPDDIREMVENAMANSEGGSGGGVQMMMIGGDDNDDGPDPEMLRESLGLPEDAEISFTTSVVGGPPPTGARMLRTGGPVAQRVPLDPILQELDPGRPPRLAELDRIVTRLVAARNEDGSWGSGAETFRTTTAALAALGSAQRVGLALPPEPIERGVTWLRESVAEGKLAGSVARGADRRTEWVRAAHALRALHLLNCSRDDELRTRLEQFLGTAQAAEAATAEDLLSHALLARAGGVTAWQRFYDDARLRLVAAQTMDGRFDFAGDTQRDTAVGALLLALQHERTPVLTGTAGNPAAGEIDGYGRPPAPIAMPEAGGPGGVQMLGGSGQRRAVMQRIAISPDGSIDMDVDVEDLPPAEDPD